MSIDLGAIYFDQRKRAAGRGYGYVDFRSRGRCSLYGKLRRTDFLPVDEQEDDVLQRGVMSESSDEGKGRIEDAFSDSLNLFDLPEDLDDGGMGAEMMKLISDKSEPT